MSSKAWRLTASAIDHWETRNKDLIQPYERIAIALAVAGKDTVLIAPNTRAVKKGDTKFQVTFNHHPIATVDGEVGITLHWDADTPDGPIRDRLVSLMPVWPRINVSGQVYQQNIFYPQFYKSLYLNVNKWTVRNGRIAVINWKMRDVPGDLVLTWKEIQETLAELEEWGKTP